MSFAEGLLLEIEAIRAARGSVLVSVQSLVTTLIATVAFAFTARILTQVEMGIMVGLTLASGAFQILSDIGFGNGLVKYVAEYKGKNEDYTLISFGGILTKVSLAGLLALFCASFATQLSSFLLKDVSYAFLFQWLSMEIFLVCVFTTLNKLFIGLNMFRRMAILNIMAAATRQSLIIVFLILGHGLRGLITGWILGNLVHVVTGCILLVKGGHIKMHSPARVGPHLKRIFLFSWPLFFSDLILFLYGWFDRAILLAFVPLDEVAVYNVAFTAFSVIAIAPTAVSTALLPYFSEQLGKSMHDKIAIGANVSTRYITMIYPPLALGLMSLATPTLTFFAGEGYAEGGLVLAILSLLGGIAGMGAAFSVLLLVYSKTLRVLSISIASTGLGVILSLLLLPVIGIIGVAMVKGLVLNVSFILTFAAVRKLVPIKFDKEALWKCWFAALLMSIVVVTIAHVFPARYLVLLYVLVGGATYLISLRILRVVKEEDIQLARSFLGKKAGPIVTLLEKSLLS